MRYAHGVVTIARTWRVAFVNRP